MIDIHCHIIPNIDDGPKSISTTMDMLKIAQEDGMKTLIATPHYCPGISDNSFDEVVNKVLELKKIVKENNIKINILSGQEIFLTSSTLKEFNEGLIKGLNNSRYMLIELPMDYLPDYALDILYELKIKGITPIIAHPERYFYIISNLERINDLIETGCLFQINSGSIAGEYGKQVRKCAYKLIDNGIIDFIASDAHGSTIRKPQLKYGYDLIKHVNTKLPGLLMERTEKLFCNKAIEIDHLKLEVKRSIFSFIG